MLNKIKELLFGAYKNGKANRDYRCINCGSNVKDLYKNYSSTIQKLAECVCFICNFLMYNSHKNNYITG